MYRALVGRSGNLSLEHRYTAALISLKDEQDMRQSMKDAVSKDRWGAPGATGSGFRPTVRLAFRAGSYALDRPQQT